jgi:hypothetical protein
MVVRIRAEADAGGTNDQCVGIRARWETPSDHGDGLDPRLMKFRRLQIDANHCRGIDDVAVGGNCAVEDIRDKQRGVITGLQPSHIPWPVDGAAAESFDHVAEAVENDQASRLRRCRSSIAGRKTADDDPSGAKNGESGGQTDATGASAGKSGGIDLREERDRAVGRDIDDRRPCPLLPPVFKLVGALLKLLIRM